MCTLAMNIFLGAQEVSSSKFKHGVLYFEILKVKAVIKYLVTSTVVDHVFREMCTCNMNCDRFINMLNTLIELNKNPKMFCAVTLECKGSASECFLCLPFAFFPPLPASMFLFLILLPSSLPVTQLFCGHLLRLRGGSLPRSSLRLPQALPRSPFPSPPFPFSNLSLPVFYCLSYSLPQLLLPPPFLSLLNHLTLSSLFPQPLLLSSRKCSVFAPCQIYHFVNSGKSHK